MRKRQPHSFSDFNAGRFLRGELAKSGHDVAWLAERSGYEQDYIARLFLQSNMDAELFVSVGRHLGESFFAALDAIIFHDTSAAVRKDA